MHVIIRGRAVHVTSHGQSIRSSLAPAPSISLIADDIETGAVEWCWIHCLTILLETYSFQWSRKPFKWICFAIGVVIGAPGHLSSTQDAPTPVNYDDDLSTESLDLYYHVDADERMRMFPTDPRLQNTRSKTSTSRSSRWRGFSEEIEQRDGTGVCCDTAVGIPLVSRRSRAPPRT